MNEEINVFASAAYIHYQAERIDYAISDSELDQLRQCSDNQWKDFCLGCSGIGIPCALNAASLGMKSLFTSPEFVLNSLFGLVGIVLGIAFGVAWHKSQKSASTVINRIKSKPKIRLQ